jgi:hypothetical protein
LARSASRHDTPAYDEDEAWRLIDGEQLTDRVGRRLDLLLVCHFV